MRFKPKGVGGAPRIEMKGWVARFPPEQYARVRVNARVRPLLAACLVAGSPPFVSASRRYRRPCAP